MSCENLATMPEENNKKNVARTTAFVAAVSLVAASFPSNRTLAAEPQDNTPITPPPSTRIITNEESSKLPPLPAFDVETSGITQSNTTVQSNEPNDIVKQEAAKVTSHSLSFKDQVIEALQKFYCKYTDSIKSILAAIGTFSLGYLVKGWRKEKIKHGNQLNELTRMPAQLNVVIKNTIKSTTYYASLIRDCCTTKTIGEIFGLEAKEFLKAARNTNIDLPLVVNSDIKTRKGRNTQLRWLNLIANEVNAYDQAFTFLDKFHQNKINDIYIFITCEDGKNTNKDFPTKPRIFILTKDEIEFYATKEFFNHAAVEEGKPSHIYRVNALHNICRAFVKGMNQDEITSETLKTELSDEESWKNVTPLEEGVHYVKRSRAGETDSDAQITPVDPKKLKELSRTGKLL